jgi:hypothetical protein
MEFSKLSMDEVKSWVYDKPENIEHLRDFFGNKNTPPHLEAGQNLTRENLEAYQELAQRVIDASKDSLGVQASRIQQIIDYLEGAQDVT